jgi:solute carrier family 25 S-adenosylmethionine transporter 26
MLRQEVGECIVVTQELTSQNANQSIVSIMRKIAQTEGARALYAGIGPRVAWISLGGAVFFGAYEQSRILFSALV